MVRLGSEYADPAQHVLLILAEELVTLLERLPQAHGLVRIGIGETHHAVPDNAARHRRLHRIPEAQQLLLRLTVHRQPALHPHALGWLKMPAQALGERQVAFLHGDLDARPDHVRGHVPGLAPCLEHRLARRRQAAAGEPQLAGLVHQAGLLLACLDEVRETLAVELVVRIDVTEFGDKRVPVAALSELLEPLLAQLVAHDCFRMALKEVVQLRDGRAGDAILQQFVIEIRLQGIAV